MGMIKTTVKAGVCGFTTRISADSEDEQHVTIGIETDCEKIRKLADSLPVLDSYSEINVGHEGELMKAVRNHLKGCCAGCAVPSGLFKSMQVAASLALPQAESMEIKPE